MLSTVSIHTTPLEAHIIASRLRHEGILSFLGTEYHIWMKWSLSFALGGVRVQVPSSCLAEAKSIIDRINSGEYAQELNSIEDMPLEPECPACSSTLVTSIRWTEKLALLVVFLFLLPIPYNQHKYKCKACGHRWEAHEERGYSRTVISVCVLSLALLLFILQALYCEWCKTHCLYPPLSCS